MKVKFLGEIKFLYIMNKVAKLCIIETHYKIIKK